MITTLIVLIIGIFAAVSVPTILAVCAAGVLNKRIDQARGIKDYQ